MQVRTLRRVFRAMFDSVALTASAKALGVQQRDGGKILPVDLLLSLLGALCIGPDRSIAAARRAWEHLTGNTVARGAFDAQVEKPALVRWTWQVLCEALACSNRALRRQWPAALREIHDIVLDDGSRMPLVARLAHVRGTSPGQAAIKLMASMSLGSGQLADVRMGAAVHHDRRLLPTTAYVAGALYLRDLGFYDHRLFAQIAAADSWFVSRLKATAVPHIVAVTCGVTSDGPVVGARLDEYLTYADLVDLDAEFRVAGAAAQTFRVVMLAVPLTDRHDRATGGTRDCWFVTNLPRETWSVAAIAALYRLRWALERLFRASKHLARLDHLKTGRLTVLYTFIAVSLLFQVLADRVAAALMSAHGIAHVSPDRVVLTLLHWWSDIARWLRRPDAPSAWPSLERVLRHETRHPNPGQPRRITTVFHVLDREPHSLARAT